MSQIVSRPYKGHNRKLISYQKFRRDLEIPSREKTMCEFDRQYNQLMGLINDYLYNLLGKMERYPGIIYDSIEYSLFAGQTITPNYLIIDS